MDPYAAVDVITNELKQLEDALVPYELLLREDEYRSNAPLPPEPPPIFDMAVPTLQDEILRIISKHIRRALDVTRNWFYITDHDKQHHTAFRLLYVLKDPLLSLHKLCQRNDHDTDSVRDLVDQVKELAFDARCDFPFLLQAPPPKPTCRLRVATDQSRNWCYVTEDNGVEKAFPIPNDGLSDAIAALVDLGPTGGPEGGIRLTTYCHSRELEKLDPAVRRYIVTTRGRPTRFAPVAWR